MSSLKREVSADSGSLNENGEEKPRLTEDEKKANHIASGTPTFPSTFLALISPSSRNRVRAGLMAPIEQKRRQAIREGFDRLTELVPGLEGQGRSESVVLKKTVDYMREQLAERKKLVGRIEDMGGQVEEGMKR